MVAARTVHPRRFLLLAGLLLTAGCVPLTRAHLQPETSFQRATAQALRISQEAWRLELRLPDPGGAVDWQVVPEDSPPATRRAEGDQAVFAWEISAARWRDKRPFQVRIQAAGVDELVSIPHPTFEQALAKPLWIALQILRPIPRF